MAKESNMHFVDSRMRLTDVESIRKVTGHANVCLRCILKTSANSIDELQWDQLLESLRFDEMDDRHRTIQPAYGTTCRWLINNSKFRDWRDWNNAAEHHGFFWLKGKPGAGKSTLTKFALSETKKLTQDAIHISFFFNRRGMDLEKDILGMYRSLLSQLLTKIPRPEEVLTRLDPPLRLNQIPRWTVHMLKDVLDHAVQVAGQTRLFLFIDALDECGMDEVNSQIQDMIAFFQTLTEQSFNTGARLNIFLSSRYYPTITVDKGLELELDAENEHAGDIEVYIRSKLKTFGTNKWAKAIRAAVLEKAQGIFLWVVLVIPILKREYDEGDKSAVKKKLKDIPGDLGELFKGILTRDDQRLERMRICIQWILFAKEPLTPDELYHAVLSSIRDPEDWDEDGEEEGEEEDDDLDENPKHRASGHDEPEKGKPSTLFNTTNDGIRRFVVASSKGLAELTNSTQPRVQLIHESVREYLLNKGGLQLLQIETGICHALSHDRLKSCCESYLNRKQLEDIISQKLLKASSPEGRQLRASTSRKHPFLEYSVRNIFHHAELAAENGVSQVDFLDTFRLGVWVHLYNLLEKHQIRRYTLEVSLTYIFAEKNFSTLIRSIPPEKMKFDEWIPNERYKSPIHAALAKKNSSAITAMLSISNLNGDDQPGAPILHNLIEKYHQNDKAISKRAPLYFLVETLTSSMVLCFIQTGRLRAEIHHSDVDGKTPLCFFASNGNEAVVKLLLDTGKVDVDSKDYRGQTPLSWAAENGHEGIVKLLLDTGKVDVDSKNSHGGRTPLSWAAEKGHEGIVKLLLDTGKVDVDSKNSHVGRTPLWWAAEKGHEGIVKLLLDTGKADVDSKDSHDQTPLSWAAEKGHEGIVKLLLDTGKVDVDWKAYYSGPSPLSWAAQKGHEGIVKLLLDTGKVNVNSKNSYSGRTPLWWAAEKGHEGIVKLLLDTGKVGVDSKNSHDQTPLSWAAEKGHEGIVKLLLDTGKVDVNSKDYYSGPTPLSWAAQKGHEGIVKLLLDTGKVDVDSKDYYSGPTPLSWAAQKGHEGIVKLLLDTGKVDVDSKDYRGQTPLSWAAEKGHEGIVKLLLDTGKVDVNSKNSYSGRTPLLWAAEKGHEGIVKLLLDTGKVGVDSKNSHDQTPLSWAAEKGHEGIVKLLLDTGKVDVNSKDYYSGPTPLSWAAQKGHEGIVKLLLDTGKVDVDSKDYRGQTPLSWAAEKGHEGIVKLLLDTGKVDVDSKDSHDQTPLSWAAEKGHEGIVKLLLDTGKVDVDSKDYYSGRTPLSWAAEKGHEGIVKLLLDTGKVDVNSKNSYSGPTPLSWAAEKGHEGIVKLLLDTGKVDVNSKDYYSGRTPLSWATEKGHEGIVKLLLDTGKVDVNSKNSYSGRTPLLWAAEKGHEGIVKLLLDTGKVDVDSKNSYSGPTPLSWAAEKGHEGIVKLLLDTGKVDVDSKDYRGQTPLSWAAEKGHEGIVKLLLDTGKVDVDSKDYYSGRTPLSWAAEMGHEGIVNRLLPPEVCP